MKQNREPLVHLVKRDNIAPWKPWVIRAATIVGGLIFICLLCFAELKISPFKVLKYMFVGSFGSEHNVLVLFRQMSLLLIIALAITPAFKMRFWNIGGEGQVLIGGLATTACMVLLGGKIPNALLILVMIIASVLAGALWALIPAVFKARFNTNETLFTLMMNYVAIQLVSYFCMLWENPKGAGKIGIINRDTEAGWLPVIADKSYLLNILVVLAITVGMYIYLKYSKHGYEISVVGESENTARYIGINVKKVILRTMFLSGAICGIAGLLLVGGTDHTISTTTADGRGFTAIMVSWLAKFNPIYMILTSLLLVFLEAGADQISMIFGLNQSFSEIITGIILFFIIGSEFFINYKLQFRNSSKKEVK